jgi:hypothetical protein
MMTWVDSSALHRKQTAVALADDIIEKILLLQRRI